MAAVIPSLLGAFLNGPVLQKILDLIPDVNKKAEIQLQLAQLAASQEAKQIDALVYQAQSQSQVNLAEAQSTDKFKSYWRPAAAWICVAGMFFSFIFVPTSTWVAALFGYKAVFPAPDVATLVGLLTSMLGLGTWRTIDKINGVASG